jgi:hypothetical protein
VLPSGVTLLDEVDLVVVTLLAPRLEVEETIEEETELIGEDGEVVEGGADEEGADGGGESEGDASGDESGDDAN